MTSLRDRYAGMHNAEWFRDAHDSRSLGPSANVEQSGAEWFEEWASKHAMLSARSATLDAVLAVAQKKSSSNKARKIRERIRDKACKSPHAWSAGFHCGWRALRELILQAAGEEAPEVRRARLNAMAGK